MVFLIKVDQPQYVRSVTTDSYQASAERLCGKKISIETGMVMTKKGNETESICQKEERQKGTERKKETNLRHRSLSLTILVALKVAMLHTLWIHICHEAYYVNANLFVSSI